MKKREQAFQTKFNKWCKYNIHETSCFELKYCNGTALPFSAVKEHQIQNLLNAKHRFLLWKIPDSAIGEKPFDSFFIKKAQGYIVIQYAPRTTEKGENKKFYMIDIDVFVKEMATSDRKSLTIERAKEIGTEQQLGVINSQ